jgi:hypothetical protein
MAKTTPPIEGIIALIGPNGEAVSLAACPDHVEMRCGGIVIPLPGTGQVLLDMADHLRRAGWRDRTAWWVAIGTDGKRHVVWGLGDTPEAAQRDGEAELREQCDVQDLAVVEIDAARLARLQAGDVDASDLVDAARPVLMLPTIHLGGSDPDDLRRQVTAAGMAVRRAREAVAAACPNGRDYYKQGPDALRRATRQHEARLVKLQDVEAELQALAHGISRGGHGAMRPGTW